MPATIARSIFSIRTGVAILGSTPPETQLALALGKLETEFATDTIVHELMHHNAANSPVNVALQYRWLALLRTTLSTPGLGIDGRHAEMAAHLAATEALLQPLAEGLAHFAEFDCSVPDPATADPSNLIITAIDWIRLLLLPLKEGVTHQISDQHRASVAEKLSSTQTRRRADVLSHPLYPRTMNDAYLIGYLVVKAAWDIYVEESGGARLPAGAFVEFVHYWFYEDWRLAELLLRSGPTGTYAVVDRLRSRARLLLNKDLPARVGAFSRDKTQRHKRGMLLRGPEERKHGPIAGLELEMRDIVDAHLALRRFFRDHVGPEAPLTQGPSPDPGTDADLAHEGMVRPLPEEERPSLQAYFERNPGDPKTPLRLLDFFLEMPRLNRTRVALLDLPLEVDVDDDRVVALRVDDDQAPWHEPPGPIATGTIAPGRHRGRLVGIVMSTTSPWRLDCFVVIDGLVRGAWSSGQPKDDELAETVQQINYYEAFRKPTGMRPEAFLMQAISASRLSGQEAPDIAAHTDEATITVSMALREVLAEHGWGGLFSTIPTAADSGVRTLLTGPLVRALSATGLVNSYSNSRSEIAHQLASIGHDLDELIDACNRLASERAVRLLDTDAESVRARV